jgi:hypothetical protein
VGAGKRKWRKANKKRGMLRSKEYRGEGQIKQGGDRKFKPGEKMGNIVNMFEI